MPELGAFATANAPGLNNHLSIGYWTLGAPANSMPYRIARSSGLCRLHASRAAPGRSCAGAAGAGRGGPGHARQRVAAHAVRRPTSAGGASACIGASAAAVAAGRTAGGAGCIEPYRDAATNRDAAANRAVVAAVRVCVGVGHPRRGRGERAGRSHRGARSRQGRPGCGGPVPHPRAPGLPALATIQAQVLSRLLGATQVPEPAAPKA